MRRPLCLMLACGPPLISLSLPAAAADADPAYSASVGYFADDADGSQALANVEADFATHWIRGTVGNTRSDRYDDSVSTVLGGLRVGMRSQYWSGSIGGIYRSDGDKLKQTDLSATVDRLFPRGKLGVDAFYRNAKSSVDSTVIVSGPRNDSEVVVSAEDKVDGPGYGVHGEVDLTDTVMLFASGAWYDYDESYTVSEGSDGIDLPDRLLRAIDVSGATRDEGTFDASYSGGGLVRMPLGSVSLTYYRDEIFDSADAFDTFELAATFFLGERWSVTPVVSHSSGGGYDDVMSGGLTVGMSW